MTTPLFELEDFTVEIPTPTGIAQPVHRLSLSVRSGCAMGIVGESGSGKSVAMLAACGLLPRARTSGAVRFDGEDILALPSRVRRSLLGRHIGMVFQEPMTALNPVMRIDRQIAEPLVVHGLMERGAAMKRALELLERTGIPRPEQVARCLPHELSGGMRQRVGIAVAIACGPRLLIADEPTTALDATVQAQILRLLLELRKELGMALVMITHDLGIISQITDEVCVLYAGNPAEQCPTASLFDDPQHPYTVSLLGSLPRTGQQGERLYAIEGSVPSALVAMPGCRFAPRCPIANPDCLHSPPVLHRVANTHFVACHRAPIESMLEQGSTL